MMRTAASATTMLQMTEAATSRTFASREEGLRPARAVMTAATAPEPMRLSHRMAGDNGRFISMIAGREGKREYREGEANGANCSLRGGRFRPRCGSFTGDACRWPRPSLVRHGCDSKSRTDVGSCLHHPGRDVRRRRHARELSPRLTFLHCNSLLAGKITGNMLKDAGC